MDNVAKDPKFLQWFEPRWSYLPRLKVEVLKFLDIKMWFRATLFSATLIFLMAYGLRRAMPNLQIDWPWVIAQAVGFFAVLLVFIFGILWAFPPIILITPKGISCQQGRQRNRADIRSITIDATNPKRPRMEIETAGKSVECGIAARISLKALITFLKETFPELIVVEKR